MSEEHVVQEEAPGLGLLSPRTPASARAGVRRPQGLRRSEPGVATALLGAARHVHAGAWSPPAAGFCTVKGEISLAGGVVAPGLMVLAIILFMGAVSGAHLNPAVSLAFALRGDFPVEASPRVHHRPADRCDAGVPVPARGVRQHPASRRHAARPGLCELAGAADGDRPHRDPRQRDLGNRVLRAERRRDRRARRRRVHSARRAVVGACERHLDEPGALLRPGAGERRLHELLGVCRWGRSRVR